jgi:hypothetical protein
LRKIEKQKSLETRPFETLCSAFFFFPEVGRPLEFSSVSSKERTLSAFAGTEPQN